MTVALSRTAQQAAPVDPAAYAATAKLPQIAAHDADSDAKLADARAQATAATGGFVAAPPPSPPLPADVYHDGPQTQAWRNSGAAAPDPAAAVFAPKGISSAAAKSSPVSPGISGEAALGLPEPPLTTGRLRDSDYDEDY